MIFFFFFFLNLEVLGFVFSTGVLGGMTCNNPNVKETSEETSHPYFIFQSFVLHHVILKVLSGWVLGCTFFFFDKLHE